MNLGSPTPSDPATSDDPYPLEQAPNLPEAVRQVLDAARRVHTPCGTGGLVWHIWGEQGADPALAPLVLLHGGSGSWTHWLRNVMPLAATGRRVYVPDLPGFGDSDMPPGGADADVIPEPLAQGLDRLVGAEPCDLVGFSFGGMVGGLLASRYPARVARLVMVGAPGFGLDALEPVRLKGWRHLPDAEQRMAVHHHNLQVLMLHDPASITELACQLQAANAVRDRLPGRRLARTDVLVRALPALTCPVHLFYGDQDPYYRGQAPDYEARMRGASQFRGMGVIAGAGHWAQFEKPELFNRLLLAALNESR
jgi:pimeloyl-ACP methyl ester carboxylesterase